MKKFKFFTLLAIVATISTSFAAWTYSNFAEQYTAVAVGQIEFSVDDSDVEASEALEIEITNTSMPSVTYSQNSNDMAKIDVTVSDDVTIKVKENIVGAIDKYDYYYAVHIDSYNDILSNVKAKSEVKNDDGTVIVDAVKNNKLVLSADGEAVISKEELAEIFATNRTLCTTEGSKGFKDSLDTFKAAVTELNHVLNNSDNALVLEVYAVKNN